MRWSRSGSNGMKHFESTQGGNSEVAPEKLIQEEALEVSEKIGDARLSADEDVEHFIITIEEKRVFVPKRKTIYTQNESGSFEYVDIERYLREKLDSLK